MTLINPDEQKNRAGDAGPNTAIKVRTPKRILHFSDGILEEYSTDEELDNPPKEEQAVVDPNTLTWGPWFWYKAWRAGAGTLAVVDSIGEFLAAFFGITTPKYYFELEEYRRKEAELQAENEQKKGWSERPNSEGLKLNDITTTQPKPVDV
ncbi:protein FAM177A1, partial [Asbolus verrucosus]